jgi:hypothetical protein
VTENNPPLLPVFSGAKGKGNEPFGFWLFTRQDLFLKVQAGVAIVIVLLASVFTVHQNMQESARAASWSQVERASMAGDDLGIVQGCESFFSTSPPDSDSRVTEGKELYRIALVRWFTKTSGDLDSTALAHMQQYRQISASWSQPDVEGGAKCREYHRTVFNVLGAGGLIFARSGFAGTQAFPGCWAGDNEPNFGVENGLPSVILAGLSAAMSGFSMWGHDVGGYLNANFSPVSPSDLFIRWTQFGCFSPIMQMHRQIHAGSLRQYPWGYAESGESTDNNRALANYRFYAMLHTRLFPYLYTYAKQSGETGLPILRPLVLLHQDDPRTMSVEHTYYFGGDLLVAPIIEANASTRQLYLPEGEWFDFWTN